MTRSTSLALAPTRAIRNDPSARASALTHSAPALVLPKPRPAEISQVRQSPGGGSWPSWAQNGHCSRTVLCSGSVRRETT